MKNRKNMGVNLIKQPVNNTGKIGKAVIVEDYGIFIPTCPFCHEPLYEKKRCVFCGATIEEDETIENKLHELNNDLVSTYENIVVEQTCNALYVYEDKKMVMHCTIEKPKTQDELNEFAKTIYEGYLKKFK